MKYCLIALLTIAVVFSRSIENREEFNGFFDTVQEYCTATMKEMFGNDVVTAEGFDQFMEDNDYAKQFCEDAEKTVQCATGALQHYDLVGDECITQFYNDWKNVTDELKEKFVV